MLCVKNPTCFFPYIKCCIPFAAFPAVSLLWLGGKGFSPGAILQVFVVGPFDNYVDLLLITFTFIAEPS